MRPEAPQAIVGAAGGIPVLSRATMREIGVQGAFGRVLLAIRNG